MDYLDYRKVLDSKIQVRLIHNFGGESLVFRGSIKEFLRSKKIKYRRKRINKYQYSYIFSINNGNSKILYRQDDNEQMFWRPLEKFLRFYHIWLGYKCRIKTELLGDFSVKN